MLKWFFLPKWLFIKQGSVNLPKVLFSCPYIDSKTKPCFLGDVGPEDMWRLKKNLTFSIFILHVLVDVFPTFAIHDKHD